jgi:hypothetical protein
MSMCESVLLLSFQFVPVLSLVSMEVRVDDGHSNIYTHIDTIPPLRVIVILISLTSDQISMYVELRIDWLGGFDAG